MIDCSNAEFRDALPDLMHGTLPPARLSEVQTHLRSCAACRAELALLERVRDSVAAPALNFERIAASLPAYRPVPLWKRARSYRRIAAGMLLAAGVATFLLRSGERSGVDQPDSVAQIASATPTELAIGVTFEDVSDGELRALADAIGELDAVLSEEPDAIAVPVAPTEGL